MARGQVSVDGQAEIACCARRDTDCVDVFGAAEVEEMQAVVYDPSA
jgi:hypothetical protein